MRPVTKHSAERMLAVITSMREAGFNPFFLVYNARDTKPSIPLTPEQFREYADEIELRKYSRPFEEFEAMAYIKVWVTLPPKTRRGIAPPPGSKWDTVVRWIDTQKVENFTERTTADDSIGLESDSTEVWFKVAPYEAPKKRAKKVIERIIGHERK